MRVNMNLYINKSKIEKHIKIICKAIDFDYYK